MRPIPQNLRKIIENDSFYRICCLRSYRCEGKIEIHHNFIYSGRQQNYLFCLLPLCQYHHKIEKSPKFRDDLDRIMLRRTTLEFLIKTFPKRDWIQLNNYLNAKST